MKQVGRGTEERTWRWRGRVGRDEEVKGQRIEVRSTVVCYKRKKREKMTWKARYEHRRLCGRKSSPIIIEPPTYTRNYTCNNTDSSSELLSPYEPLYKHNTIQNVHAWTQYILYSCVFCLVMTASAEGLPAGKFTESSG